MYKDVPDELLNHSDPIVSNLATQVHHLRGEVNKLSGFRRDAKRYRWIRDTNLQEFRDSSGIGSIYHGAVDAVTVGDGRFAAILNPRDFNRVIDEARAKFYPKDDTHRLASCGVNEFFGKEAAK